MGRLIVAVVVVGFTVYCLIDAARADRAQVRGLPKPVWLVLILILPIVGGIVWLLAGRPRSGGGGPRGGRPRHVGSPPSAPPPVRGPDDDPDFLRDLNRRTRPKGPDKDPRTDPGSDSRKNPGTDPGTRPRKKESGDRDGDKGTDGGGGGGDGTDRGAGGTDHR